MDNQNQPQGASSTPPIPNSDPNATPTTTPIPHPLDVQPGSAGAVNFNDPLAALGESTALTNEQEPAPEQPSTLAALAGGFGSVMGAIFSWIVFPVVVVLVLHNFVFQAYHVLGTSMVPTLRNADYLIISKVGYTGALIQRVFHQNATYIPDRGQIIVFHYPKDPSEVFVKRVIGLPGERVVVKDGNITVYNKAHPEGFNPDTGYEKSSTTTLGNIDETVQDGNVFVVGDNRTPGGSYDSREWGELPSSYIIGNAVLRLLPLDQVKIL